MGEAAARISRLCFAGRTLDALAAFRTFGSALRPLPTATYASLLHACAGRGLLADGAALHHHLLLTTSLLSTYSDLRIPNHLINMYCKCGDAITARKLFDEMPHRNLVSWTALVSGYAQLGMHGECLRLFSRMVRDLLPNDFALSAVLSACTEARAGGCGRLAHALALKICHDGDIHVGNALIAMYLRCYGGGGAHGNDGWRVFQGMDYRNAVTWNTIIAGLQGSSRWECVLKLFTHMVREGIGISRATLVTVLPACSDMEWCCKLHCLALKTGFSAEVAVATALVQVYSGLGGDTGVCYRVFSEAARRDVMSWNAIIAACAERCPEKAIALFCSMRRAGCEPDGFTCSIVVKACAALAFERHGSMVHSMVLKSGFANDVVLGNALVHAYARCGIIESARSFFDQMMGHDIVSWNTMINCYAIHGRAEDALGIFQAMDVPPDSTTFVSLLTACSHAGLVDKGQRLFRMMSDGYGIAPKVDHYACMVDILGRRGLLSEAEELIRQMPMEPDLVVWSALLGACRNHKEAEIAERAARKLMELQPQNSVGYVMMSNILSAEGCFDRAAIFRKGMKTSLAKKETGLSCIEIKNHVHKFSSGGQRHPEISLIINELKKLADQVKELGYVPDTSLILHDLKEECKEEMLLQHSEKLALAFGIMHASPAQVSVKIIKNIRTCTDCHNFMKLASKCTSKKILLRDTNRFHHFKGGTCSCGDFW